MPLKMFKLRPGEELRYRVALHGGGESPPLILNARRPEEGLSLELELELADRRLHPLASGRVPLAHGYLAVIKEVERQLVEVGAARPGSEVWFELQACAAAGPLESTA